MDNILEIVGKVSKRFGLQGELIINLYDCFPEDFNKEEPLFAKIDSLAVPLYLEKFERRGKSGALVRFADFDTDARAEELLGQELFLPMEAAQEKADDEIYFEDLVGYVAVFEEEKMRGKITAYIDNEFNPLFEIDIEGNEIYVPANEEMIVSLDTGSHEIGFSLPDGLLDLYLE